MPRKTFVWRSAAERLKRKERRKHGKIIRGHLINDMTNEERQALTHKKHAALLKEVADHHATLNSDCTGESGGHDAGGEELKETRHGSHHDPATDTAGKDSLDCASGDIEGE